MLTMAKKRKPWRAKLKAIRDKYDLTQAQAAAKANISTRTWIAWENGERGPGRLTLILLRQIFPNDI